MLDSLTLDHMRILIAVAETGSFSAAARKLGRVQSAISQSVQVLEDTLNLPLFDRSGKTPVLSEVGRALLADARHVVSRANAMRTHAEAIHAGVEPELTMAVDPLFPTQVLMESLRALQDAFPHLPVMMLTEGLGAPEQRLREGVVRFAIYAPLSTGADDLEADFLTHVAMVPVVAAHHRLAREPQPISRDAIARELQLVLTDRSPLTSKLRGGIYSERIWRFADLGTRLEYLLAGFGWCHMPLHLVEDLIERGQLTRLSLVQGEGFTLPLHVVRQSGQRLGRASQWFIDDIRERLATWKPFRTPAEVAAADRPRDAISATSPRQLTDAQP